MSAVTLDQLEVFLAVADAGSFSAAARRLHRSQSALSHAVAELERLLDTVLFDRMGYRPRLTAVGEVLRAHARNVASDVLLLKAVAQSAREATEARVELVIDAIFPPAVLTRSVSAYMSRYPRTELTVRSESRLTLLKLIDSGADLLAVCAQPTKLRTMKRRALRAFTAIAVAAPSHPLFTLQGAVPAHDLRRHTQLILSERDADARRAAGESVSGGLGWRMTDLTMKHAWLVAGLGWGFMPTEWVDSDIREGRLRRLVLAEGDEFHGEFFAIYPAVAQPGPAASFLLEQLSR